MFCRVLLQEGKKNRQALSTVSCFVQRRDGRKQLRHCGGVAAVFRNTVALLNIKVTICAVRCHYSPS